MIIETRPQLAHFFLRLGLAFVLVYFGVAKAVQPEHWQPWLPVFLLDVLPVTAATFLLIQGVLETIMGVLLFFGFFVRAIGILTALLLIAIAVFWGLSEVVVRDLGLLGAALYLVFQPEAAAD